MEVVKISCPNCGATDIKEDSSGKLPNFCPYCDAPIVLDDGSKTIHIDNHFVDEAKVKEAELKRAQFEYQVRQEDLMDAKKKEWRKILVAWIAVVIVLMSVSSAFSNTSSGLGTIITTFAGMVLLFGGIAVYVMKPKDEAVLEKQRRDQMMGCVSTKSKATALVLCILLGMFGGHQFYAGKKVPGIIYLFTAGLFGIGWLVDIVVIATGNFKDSNGLKITV